MMTEAERCEEIKKRYSILAHEVEDARKQARAEIARLTGALNKIRSESRDGFAKAIAALALEGKDI